MDNIRKEKEMEKKEREEISLRIEAIRLHFEKVQQEIVDGFNDYVDTQYKYHQAEMSRGRLLH